MFKIKFLVLTLALFVCASPARAWDDAGHKLSGYIAWQQMTPAARERAAKILLAAPEDSDLSVFFAQDGRSVEARRRELFMIATTWADIVRDRNFKVRFAKYHKSNWHYADTFWRQVNGRPVILERPANEEGGKAVEKLYEFEKVLRDAKVPDSEKAIALAWILHLGGDIHQPLHTSARITETEPKGDQGGNLFLLTPQGTPRENQTNLHWFWDSIVGRNVERRADACDTDYLPPIAAQMMKKYSASRMQARLKLGDYNAWQQDSFAVATKEMFPSTLVRFQMPPAAYKKRAFQIAEEQIAMAGYRLGATLNEIFDGKDGAMISRGEYEKARVDYEKRAKETGSTIGQGANDSWLWYKTRAALSTTDGLRDSTISVDVENSFITLRGTVENAAQRTKAEQAVKKIEGVKGIKNLLKAAPSRRSLN